MIGKIDKKTGVESNRALVREVHRKLVVPESHRQRAEIQRSLGDASLGSTKRRLLLTTHILRRKDDSLDFQRVRAIVLDNSLLLVKPSTEEDNEKQALKLVEPVIPLDVIKIEDDSSLQKLLRKGPHHAQAHRPVSDKPTPSCESFLFVFL